MATLTADRASSGVNARYQETGVFCEVSTYEASSASVADIIQMCKVAQDVTVLDLHIIYDALGASSTLDVGDGDDDDRYIAAQSTASAGLTRMDAATAFPRTYSTEDTIDLVVGGAAITGTITLVVFMTAEHVDLS